MRLTLRALAALLAYPSADLQAHAADIRDALQAEGALPPAPLQGLAALLGRLQHADLLDLQTDYSALFDGTRALSLNLFEHVHGESRERGPAMVDLGAQYARSGCILETRELPDFIPVFLEYASCLPAPEAREMLAQPAHVFAALAERLDERGSAYAAVFHAVLAVAAARPDAEALAALEQAEPEEAPGRIDEDWEEAPVTFETGAACTMGGPTGFVAKFRAARRAASGTSQMREDGQ